MIFELKNGVSQANLNANKRVIKFQPFLPSYDGWMPTTTPICSYSLTVEIQPSFKDFMQDMFTGHQKRPFTDQMGCMIEFCLDHLQGQFCWKPMFHETVFFEMQNTQSHRQVSGTLL